MVQQSVTPSGASFSLPPAQRSPSGPQLQSKHGGSARTIIETALCPTEMRRGNKPWSFQDLKVQSVLGEGAMSTVVQCTCSQSSLPLALKMYHREKLNSLNVRQIGREIQIHASLLHPNIIKLFAAFEDADGIYLVQEFATGGDLYAELSRHGGYMLEAHVVKNIMGPFLTALHHLHSRGILHRDIKPENILLTDQGELKLADFGLAIDTTKEKPMSRVGTLDYMPPEIAALSRTGHPPPLVLPPPTTGSPVPAFTSISPSTTASPLARPLHASPASHEALGKLAQQQADEGNYGLPADLWCTGILAYELLVGGPPFEADTKDATYTRILKTEPFIPPHLSTEAQAFIRATLQKDPSKRPTIDQLKAHPWLKGKMRSIRFGTTSPTATGTLSGGGRVLDHYATGNAVQVQPKESSVGKEILAENLTAQVIHTSNIIPKKPKPDDNENAESPEVVPDRGQPDDGVLDFSKNVANGLESVEDSCPQNKDLILASHGREVHPSSLSYLQRIMALPPDSAKPPRSRIMSAYFKKLNLGALVSSNAAKAAASEASK